ncbi:hypothetical protein ACEPAG_7213 [Sanghuangporus baumii]
MVTKLSSFWPSFHRRRRQLPIRVKLGRSRSSPSPPGSGSADLHTRVSRVTRRRPPPLSGLKAQTKAALDWSTSYQAGSSSSQSGDSSSSESDDDLHSHRRNNTRAATSIAVANGSSSPLLKSQVEPEQSGRSNSPNFGSTNTYGRRPRSPDVKALSTYSQPQVKRAISPNAPARKAQFQNLTYRCLLPNTFCITVPFPWGRRTVKASGDARKAGENILLLLSLIYGIRKTLDSSIDGNYWIAFELSGIILLSIIYLIWTHLSYFSLPQALPAKRSPSRSRNRYRSSSPQVNRKTTATFNAFPVRKDDFGYIWMTVPKNYRDCTDDGVLTALLLGPLISLACLYGTSQRLLDAPSDDSLLPSWLIEAPRTLRRPNAWNAIQSLYRSRHALVQLSSLTSSLLLVHLFSSRIYEGYHRSRKTVPVSERASVPRSEWLRSRLYISFSAMTSLAALAAKFTFVHFDIGIWSDLSTLDVAAVSVFYQFTLYMAIRLAHHGFTLGELGFATFGAAIMFMESLHVTIARMWPVTTLYIKTFRLPTPLLILQLALIPGSILVGVLLAPLLYLSRHIAQRPLRKLRFPEEKQLHRRFLALGFYFFAALVVGGLIGMWTRWCLGDRDPWIWTFQWILQGRRKWTRPLLLVYWGLLACGSIAGWGRRLYRSRKYRHSTAIQPGTASHTDALGSFVQPSSSMAPSSSSGYGNQSDPSAGANSGQSYSGPHNLVPILPNGGNVSVSAVATDFLDAADKRMPSLGLNARRKFFHALAVLMFVPGIAVDPAFTHLSFSVAFAIFTFAEYMRYFALYPFGAAIHVFLTEFVDDKDNGTAILSHFYLLTGCASTVWLEDRSRLLLFTGVLVLGIGDAMASVIGRRVGRTRWSATSLKTVEGSTAFVVSVVMCAWLLRLCGLVEPFRTARYIVVASIAAILEALSVQNDNLTLPWYTWSMQVLVDIC